MLNLLMSATGKQMTKLILYGATTLTLYILLYLFEDEFLSLSTQGTWFFIVPVATAFVFSYAHGSFTAHFWDTLGIKARK